MNQPGTWLSAWRGAGELHLQPRPLPRPPALPGQRAEDRLDELALPTGLATKSLIPAARHAAMSSGKAFAVIATIGARRDAPMPRRITRVASSPSISGIRISMQITS